MFEGGETCILIYRLKKMQFEGKLKTKKETEEWLLKVD